MTAIKHYIRIRDRIIHPEGKTENFPSIGAAKHASRMLQKRGLVVKVDHTQDPKPKPLNFGSRGSKYKYVSRSEMRQIDAHNKREARKKTRESLGLSVSQMKKVAS